MNEADNGCPCSRIAAKITRDWIASAQQEVDGPDDKRKSEKRSGSVTGRSDKLRSRQTAVAERRQAREEDDNYGARDCQRRVMNHDSAAPVTIGLHRAAYGLRRMRCRHAATLVQ